MVLTAYFVLSPVIGLSCHRHRQIWRITARSGRRAPPATWRRRRGVRTTRLRRPRQRRSSARPDRSQAFRPALPSLGAPDAAASTASRPASV